jgi:BirA family transcriptional regulator, biotin operon repressor / biotin---[acetyl-CoA-carboxylase] ligase
MTEANDANDTVARPPTRVAIESHAVLESTNILAKARVAEGAAAWTVIQATEQSAGRGRLKRDWASPPGNLYTSAILRPNRPVRDWPQLSFVVALSVAETVARAAPGAEVRVKWPNDVLANGRKVSGILLETVLPTGGGAVVVGVGINIASYPEETRYGATCVDELIGGSMPLEGVRALYLSGLARWYDIWSARGFEEVRATWLEKAHGLGREVFVENGEALDIRGRFTGVADDGRMVIETTDGALELISTGTLSFLEGEGG